MCWDTTSSEEGKDKSSKAFVKRRKIESVQSMSGCRSCLLSTAKGAQQRANEGQVTKAQNRRIDHPRVSASEGKTATLQSDLSDDDSDYYCEPLFKPEKAEDKDLEAAIIALDDKVSAKSHLPSLSDGACIKVTHGGTHNLSVSQSDSTDLETGDNIEPDSASPELETNNSTSPCFETNVSQSVETCESASPCLETTNSADASLEMSNSAKSETVKPDSCQSAVPDSQINQPASPERKGRSAGRKRRMEPDITTSPSASPQKRTMPQAVSHTMRTRFFDKKRPSIVPTTAPLSSADGSSEAPVPGSSKTGQNAGCGRRGRRPGSGRKKKTAEQEEKKWIFEKSAEEGFSDECKDGVPDSYKQEILASSINKEGGEGIGKEKTVGKVKNEDGRQEESASSAEEQKKQDLQNQVIVITSQEDLEKVTLPKNWLQSQPSLQGIKGKAEVSVMKTESNIAPLMVEPVESKLNSKVSIVTDADDNSDLVPCKKRRLHSKKVAKTYVCDMCEEVMDSRSELKKHIHVQHGNRPFACSQCSATYKCRSHLRVHLNRHVEVKPFQCPHCPKNFASNYALTAHLTVHSTERPEVCNICGLSFKSAKYLKGHMRTHDPTDKPFICQQCGTRFSRKSNLNNHLKIHNNDKQFKCPHCDRRFIQSGSLKSHVFRMHNPNRARPYVCEICGQARYAKDQFQKHMMIHTGTKPFKCEVCGAAFVQSNALKGHMKIHTEMEGKTHFCSLCHAAFKKFASLKKHLHQVHADYSDMPITYEIIEVQI